LEKEEDKIVLNTLKDIYELDNKTDKLHEIWERIVKIDYNNGEIARKLAELKLGEGNEEEAINYYKTALKRFARKHKISEVSDIWDKLLEYIPEDKDFFYYIEKEIAKENEMDAAELLKKNLDYAEINENINYAIDLLIKILRYNSKDKEIRERLVKNFKIKYKDHSQLEECLKSSSLNQTWKNFEVALDEFQKRISFDVGNYVYHRSWGIGKITELNETHMIIDFPKKKNHRMSLKMALTSLTVLPQDHIWIIKKNNIDELKDNSDEGIEKTLKILLKSLGNQASRKDIKSEMVPDIIPQKSWTKWWNKAKKIIKTSDIIGQSPSKKDMYILRENPLSYEEEALKNFQSVNNFDDKFKIFLDFHDTQKDENSEAMIEMLEFFTEVCNKSETIDDRVIKSYLLLNKLRKEKSGIGVDIQLNPNILNDLDKDVLENVFNRINNQEFKKMFIDLIEKIIPEWDKVLAYLAINTPITKAHSFILEELLRQEKTEVVKVILDEFFSNQRKNLEAYIWSIKNIFADEDNVLYKIVDTDEESILLNLIRLLDIINKDIENRKNVTQNKKMHSQIVELITKDNRLIKIISKMKEEKRKEDCKKLAALLKGTISLKEKTKSKLLAKIFEVYPELEKYHEDKSDTDTDMFMVTKKAYNKKQKESEHIKQVEIPQNSKEIGEAQNKGDLSENAEYQVAMERQKQLEAQSAKLDAELARATIIDFNNIDTSKISIGTTVSLLNLKTKKKETYSILGEWDSDLDRGIISYMSPLGKTLIGGKTTDTITFKYEGNVSKYKVLKITKAEEAK
jgi:transcription elongation factor GreA